MHRMTVRNIPDDQYEALKRVAAAQGRSAEAEARLAIARHVGAQGDVGFGSRLKAKYSGVIDRDFEIERGRTACAPVSFE